MKQLNSLYILSGTLLLLSGCATTKVDLYKYKDISSINILDNNKENYKVIHPDLNANVKIESNGWSDFTLTMRDYFLAYNDEKKVFKLDQNGSYKLKLTLHNLSSESKFTPSKYVKKLRKIKTDNGLVIKDESYYTDPYWIYFVNTAVVAELTTPDGQKKFFQADNTPSYRVISNYKSEVGRSKYVQSLQGTLTKLLKQIANEVGPEGLVISKKVSIENDEEFIFMVNMGTNEGLKEGDKLLVSKELVFKDEVDGKIITNKVRIGTATVSDQITPRYAWMMMDDEDHNSAIEVGDIIRPRY
ncbi:MAG TPA: hypothetical protein PLM93_00830 [Sulfuricurvum sp.]|nr:hypothetical protein [Sulfuricurvum sp.]HQT37757.1 hypothetical protein [Sulfuricurvum sp.]